MQGQDGEKLGMVMAHMLSARLAQLQQELITTANALDLEQQETLDDRKVPQDLARAHPITLGYGGMPFQTIDLKMNVGGVDLSGLLAYIQRFFSEKNGLRLSVNYEGNTSVVVGSLADDGESIWLAGSDKTSEIVDRIAYYLAHRRFIKEVVEAEAITPEEFRDLMSALKKVKELNRLILRGRQPEQEKYAEIIATLDTLAQKTPRWRALLRVTAEIAENARHTTKALEYYKMERALIQQDSSMAKQAEPLKWIEDKIAALTKEVDEKLKLSFPTSSGSGLQAGLSGETADRLFGPIRRLIRYVPPPPDARPVRVAMLGGVPPEGWLPDEQIEIISTESTDPEQPDEYLTDYTASLTQAVLISAPKARFVFVKSMARSSSLTTSSILSMIEALIARKPDILIITYGPLEGKIYETVFDRIAKSGILVLIAAGNDPQRPFPFAGRPILNQIMVISSVNENGQPSVFTPKDPRGFWAPGEKIPVQKFHLQNGQWKTVPGIVQGTSFATAIAAGVAAGILSHQPVTTKDLINKIRQTATPVGSDQKSAPPVLNQQAVFARLSTGQ
ncbi:S8/S53 family peptidase [Larkinella sp. VNQ87]|uniref:S8/S53 family peptidase n=1 Tax=Larkinella sp. VNQ87 TaxID=3400921 RepID=UPI003BFB2E0C